MPSEFADAPSAPTLFDVAVPLPVEDLVRVAEPTARVKRRLRIGGAKDRLELYRVYVDFGPLCVVVLSDGHQIVPPQSDCEDAVTFDPTLRPAVEAAVRLAIRQWQTSPTS